LNEDLSNGTAETIPGP